MPRWRLPRLRFSLLTLLLGVFFVGACGGLWYRWEPWFGTCLSTDNRRVFVSPDGRLFAAWCPDRVRVFSADDGSELISIPRAEELSPIGFSADGTHLVVGGKHLEVWDLAARACVARISTELGKSWHTSLYLTPGARHILVQSESSFGSDGLTCWSAAEASEEWQAGSIGPPTAHYTSEGEKYRGEVAKLALAAQDLEQFCRYEKEAFLMETPIVSPDGRSIATCLLDQSAIQVWDSTTFRRRCVLELPRAIGVSDYAFFSLNGRRLAFGNSTEQRTHVWDAETGQKLGVVLNELDGFNRSQFFTDGEYLMQLLNKWGKRTISLSHIRSGEKRILAEGQIAEFALLPGIQRFILVSSEDAWVCDLSGNRLAPLSLGAMSTYVPSVAHAVGVQKVLTDGQERGLVLWSRRRPEYWWGIVWLPEFWVAYFSGGALLVIAARNLRRRKAAKIEVT